MSMDKAYDYNRQAKDGAAADGTIDKTDQSNDRNQKTETSPRATSGPDVDFDQVH